MGRMGYPPPPIAGRGGLYRQLSTVALAWLSGSIVGIAWGLVSQLHVVFDRAPEQSAWLFLVAMAPTMAVIATRAVQRLGESPPEGPP